MSISDPPSIPPVEPRAAITAGRIGALPDGAISVEVVGDNLVLRASQQLQGRFEELLEKRKDGRLSDNETEQYEAICELDNALSWLNRLARTSNGQS